MLHVTKLCPQSHPDDPRQLTDQTPRQSDPRRLTAHSRVVTKRKHTESPLWTCGEAWGYFCRGSRVNMVNTGKPSGACGVCRERRIKCDETKPACLKCIRSGRPCSGYSHGLKLRDQTQKTIIKARLGKPRGRRQSQDQGKKSPTTPKTPKTPKTQKTPPSAGDAAQRDTTRPRSLSLPTNDDPEANGRDAEKGHARRHSTGVVKSRHQVWPLEGGADTLSWQAVHTPLVEKARCYFLASQLSPQSCFVPPRASFRTLSRRAHIRVRRAASCRAVDACDSLFPGAPSDEL